MTFWHQTMPWAVLDLETTGVSVEDDRIVTACFGMVDRSDVHTTSWLVDPGIDIPEAATAVHGVATEHARANGEPAAQAVDAVAADVAKALVAGFALVGMNLSYDLTLLDRETRRHGLPTVEERVGGSIRPIIDVFVLDKHLEPYRKGSRKLVDLCAQYGVRIDGAHDSTFDALAAARIAWRIGRLASTPRAELAGHGYDRRSCDRFAALGRMTVNDLHQAQVRWYAEQSASLGEFWQKKTHEAALRAERAAERFDTADDPAVRAEADQERMAAESEVAELQARIASLSTEWPIRACVAEEVPA